MFDGVHLSIIFTTMAIFIACIFILNIILYKPLLKFMDERSASIKNDEEKVKQNSQDMLGVDDELEKIHQETRAEINRIKQEALDEAKKSAQEQINQKKEELERKMDVFYAKLAEDKKNLELELENRLPILKNALKNNLQNI
ncbi:FoF1 ATP synthase subunit B' [Campylobacter sp. US33a]|uniref:FoF1 ATP synthase subunit B' n=1 Tax=Campylobacter sp. US33a TaxID=2498120 RepID=UPI001067FEBB|nr:FoF1 ATP synthase subunit B' [Campylobacter sp. US33a]TEY03118.1 F0F1 ATP synthase subunit B' [Campylobacter sp. US33a]